jgi:hypothetical protein
MLNIQAPGRGPLRCPTCAHPIHLDDQTGIPPPVPRGGPSSPASPPPLPRPVPPRTRKKDAGLFGLLSAAIIGPLGLLLLILSPFSGIAAVTAALLGLAVMIWAIYMMYRVFKKKGIVPAWDTVPFYLRGGAVLFYYQIKYAIQMPRLLGPWVFLQFYGMAMLLIGGIVKESVNPPPYPGWKPAPFVAPDPPRPINPNPPEKVPPRVTGDPALDRALADLDGGDPDACLRAAEKLARMQPNQHREVVAQKLAARADLPQLFARRLVVEALGVWATPNEAPTLIKCLSHEDVPTRQAALKVIGKFRDERTLAPVVRCFRDAETRDQAEKALRDMGPMAEKEVLPFLNHQDVFVRQAAIRILRDIGTRQSVPALEAAAASDNVIVAMPAREALAAIAARQR